MIVTRISTHEVTVKTLTMFKMGLEGRGFRDMMIPFYCYLFCYCNHNDDNDYNHDDTDTSIVFDQFSSFTLLPSLVKTGPA